LIKAEGELLEFAGLDMLSVVRKTSTTAVLLSVRPAMRAPAGPEAGRMKNDGMPPVRESDAAVIESATVSAPVLLKLASSAAPL
jgi:hypothetical protein